MDASRRWIGRALSLALVVSACSGSTDTESRPQLSPGEYSFSLTHDGRNRSYLVHVPPGLTGPAPLLLAFHGGGGNAAGFQAYAELDGVADREGFLVAYPNGTGLLPNTLLTWNAGDGCCGYAAQNDVDDVGFAVALIADLASHIAIDHRRIYATGHSNGGILSHRLAAERPEVIAAIAPVAGSLDLAAFSPAQAVPVLQIHSVDDPRALYDGGLGPPFPGTTVQTLHQPVQAGLDRWIAANGCATMVDTVETRVGAAGTTNAGHTATLLVWRPCAGGAEVRHWKLTVAGHSWPGNVSGQIPESISGPHTSLVNAADEVWAFVSRFAR